MTAADAIDGLDAIQGQDVLILSASEWKDNAVSNMQIAATLSESNRVVYVETMGGRMPRLSELRRLWQRLRRIARGAVLRGERQGLDPRNVVILSPFALPIHGNRLVDWLNRRILILQVRRAMRRFGMSEPVVWSFSPRWQPVVDELERRCFVFHCVDGLHTYDASPAFRSQYERTVRAADIVLTPGILLERELRTLNAATYRVGHGCGTEHLACAEEIVPTDLVGVPEPRAVYAGTLTNWVDYRLLHEVAKRLPGVAFALIGYIHALAPRDEVEALCALPNVYHLGYKNFAELPRYYRHAAVGIVPYRADNEHIRYSTPTKFLDYFAAGLSAVSTRFPASEAMGELVACADTAVEFAAAIEHALAESDVARAQDLRAFAQSRTWERQVAKMCEPIGRHLHGA